MILDTWLDLVKRYTLALNQKIYAQPSKDIDWAILDQMSFLEECVANHPGRSALSSVTSQRLTSSAFAPRSTQNLGPAQDGGHNTSSIESIWTTAAPQKRRLMVYQEALPEVVPEYDNFALKKKRLMEQKNLNLNNTATIVNKLITNLAVKKTKNNFQGYEKIFLDTLITMFKKIPTEEHATFYLDIDKILDNYR